jgi:1-acyl-sn-glycerol-3-phosphate acyltransferase
MPEPVEKMSLWYRFVRGLCQLLFAAVFRCRSRGQENFPAEGPILLLSNHQSHLDPIAIAAAAPRRLRALARESLFVGPFAWLIRSLGAIPVGSTGSTLSSLRATLGLLDRGGAMLIFAEGTRTEDGELAPLKPGFVALARRKHPVVLPMAIDGSFDAWPKHRWLPRPRRLAIVFGPPISTANLEQQSDDEFAQTVAARLAECLVEARRLRGIRPTATQQGP